MITPPDNEYIISAKNFAPLLSERPARGKELLAPLAIWDNAHIRVKNGRVAQITRRRPHWALKRVEIDDGMLIPPVANAHTHLQLSHTRGRTLWGKGFAPWLKSLLPLLRPDPRAMLDSIPCALDEIRRSGARFAGDIGGSLPGSMAAVSREAARLGVACRHFCEWFGWESPRSPWPSRARKERFRLKNPAPCGHALYSTSPESLRLARQWTKSRGLPFCFHLAESAEEDDALIDGKGPLYEFYKDRVLPPGWKPPRMRPAEYAARLSLLGPGTLAVHGVRLSEKDIKILSDSGSALCLCPRSNAALAVGEAPFAQLLESGALLCLGTDGLSSSPDLDVREEACRLREIAGYPARALIRMLTVNGASALGFDPTALPIREGSKARFALLKIA